MEKLIIYEMQNYSENNAKIGLGYTNEIYSVQIVGLVANFQHNRSPNIKAFS